MRKVSQANLKNSVYGFLLIFGSAYIRGEIALEEALDAIEKQAAIYMAE